MSNFEIKKNQGCKISRKKCRLEWMSKKKCLDFYQNFNIML